MKKLILSIAVLLIVVITVTSCKSDAKKDTEEVKTEVVNDAEKAKEEMEEVVEIEEMAMATYQCPMKCEGDKTYDQPGQCPTCKMDLAEVKSEGETEEHDHEEETEEENEG